MKELSFLDELVAVFEKLPGVGKKTATRYAYYCIDNYTIDDINHICKVLTNTFSSVHKCEKCGMYTTSNICDICKNEARNHKKILVVKDPKDLISLENSNQYDGTYLVIGGLISVMDGIGPEDLYLAPLYNKLQKGEVDEVILALSLTPAGDITSMYIEKLLEKYPQVVVSRIGYGLPAGSDLEYADELTIKRALEYRVTRKK